MPRNKTTSGTKVRSITLVAALGLLGVIVTAWAVTDISKKLIADAQEAVAAELRSNLVDSPVALVGRLYQEQQRSIQLFIPGMPKPVCFSGGILSFDPATWPKEMLDGLVYDVVNKSPVYEVRVREDRVTRRLQILNADGKVVYAFNPESDYDPLWLARLIHPEIFGIAYSADNRAFTEEWLDPSHVEVEFELIPVTFVDTYAENSVASLWDLLAEQGKEAKSSILPAKTRVPMLMMGNPATDIIVTEHRQVSTGMYLKVTYPSTVTNSLEVMVSTDLVSKVWWLVATNLATTSTNFITWVDTSATNVTGGGKRFYSIGNSADSDSDGLADGREVRIYNTNPDSVDSDGDGVVDGYSGVVTTNSYPGGVATNGSPYVEGELSWGAAPAKFDTDGDGMGDGWEINHGHNPLDPNDPPNVSGTVFYSGRQTGTVWVVAVTDSNSWSTGHSYTSPVSGFPVSYQIPDLEQTNYWIKSWLDSNGNGQTNTAEAQGVLTNIQTVITNRVAGQDITLADPDNNTNGLPDWWEILHFGSTTNTTGSADPDSDQYTNLEEYNANTDPTNSLSHPWNLSGTVSYTGPQTGIIYVVACTNSDLWNWVGSTVITNTGAYTITHLPPEADYWVRAWVDTSGDGLPTSWEGWGGNNGNPVTLNTNATGINFAMTDPDNDEDGIADWWEVLYGLDPTGGGEGGAVAWWRLDEGAGTNIHDETANANNGTLINCGTNAWVTGIISNALSFSGTNAYVQVPDSASLKPSVVSLSMWITPSKLYTNGAAMFLSKRVSAGSYGYSLGYENGKVTFTFCSSGAKSLGYSCALTSGVPIHVAGSYSGTLQTLFINGEQVASTNYNWGNSFGTLDHDTNVVRLGASSGNSPTNFFAGTLDDVRVFPNGLTTNEVRAIWELGADSDHDGLSNSEEYKNETNPTNNDTDADGMPDGWEVKYHLNPQSAADASADADGDGLTNLQEFQNNCSPISSDTDGDGLPDGWEIAYGYNPVSSNAMPFASALGSYWWHHVIVTAPTNLAGQTCTVAVACSSTTMFSCNSSNYFSTNVVMDADFNVTVQTLSTSAGIDQDTITTYFDSGNWHDTNIFKYTVAALAGVTNSTYRGLNETNTFTNLTYAAETTPPDCAILIAGSLAWSGGGDPACADTGASFTSKFEAGLHPVCVYNRWNHANGNLFDDAVIAIGSTTLAYKPLPHSRTDIGIGEFVDLEPVPVISNFTWSTSAGIISTNPANPYIVTLIALDQPTNCLVTLHFPGGTCQKTFNVLAPSCICYASVVSNVSMTAGISGAEAFIDAVFAPTNVCFRNVSMMEIGCVATNGYGYYALFPPVHSGDEGAFSPSGLSDENAFRDRVLMENGSSWNEGGFEWHIPVITWVTGSTNLLAITNWVQSFAISSNGTVTIAKYEHGISRTTNDVSNIW